MTKKVIPSWEKERSEIHSPEGVKDLRKELRFGLIRKYTGMAEAMFEYNLKDFDVFEDMTMMTWNTEPERTMMRNGWGTWFEVPRTGQWNFLPAVVNGDVNINGMMNSWSPIPVGYDDSKDPGKSPVRDDIRNLKLDWNNSALMFDNRYRISDYTMICKMVDALVDNMLTINQLTLLAKSPYVFNVTEDNYLDAKNYFLALAEDKPAIFKYRNFGEQAEVVEPTPTVIDPSLFETYRKWEDLILEQLGIPGSQRQEKQAQQTVAEVSLNDDMVSIRRKEKLDFRQMGIDRLNKLAGTDVQITSIIDSIQDEIADAGGDPEDVPGNNKGGNNYGTIQ